MNKKQFCVTISVLPLLAIFFSCQENGNNTELPKEAKEFLTNNFPQREILSIEETKNQMDYIVLLDDKTEIEFSNTGDWEEINLKRNDITQTIFDILPKETQQYIQENHSDKTIHTLEKRSFGRNNYIYRVSFYKPNDIELSFTKDGELISSDPTGKKLPSITNAFLKKHYPEVDIVSIENDVDGDYNIRLSDKTEIEFNHKGNWSSIKTSKKRAFPESVIGLLPKNINKYISKNYPDQYIRQIEKKSYGYRIKLNKPNNVELSFTKSGDFQRIESKATEQVE